MNTNPSIKYTGGNHYEVLLYNGRDVINFLFESEFGQYCDCVQMSKLMDLINIDSEKTNEIDANKNVPYIIEEANINLDDMDSEEAELEYKNMEQFKFGETNIGQVIYYLFELIIS